MDRSSKHSPRIDDELAHDLQPLTQGQSGESHTRESRLQESPIDGEPGLSLANRPDVEDDPGIGLSTTSADARAELARHLAGVAWPATADELRRAAADDNADDGAVARLSLLPQDDTRYGNVQEVWAATGGDVEGRHTAP